MLSRLRHVMARAGYADWPHLAGVFALAGAMLPVVALASGDAATMDPATAAGGGAATVAAVGALAYAVRHLADRGTDAPPSSPPTGPTPADAQQSVRIAELRTEVRHLTAQVARNAELLDRHRDDLAAAVRALDRAVGRIDTLATAVGTGGNQG